MGEHVRRLVDGAAAAMLDDDVVVAGGELHALAVLLVGDHRQRRLRGADPVHLDAVRRRVDGVQADLLAGRRVEVVRQGDPGSGWRARIRMNQLRVHGVVLQRTPALRIQLIDGVRGLRRCSRCCRCGVVTRRAATAGGESGEQQHQAACARR